MRAGEENISPLSELRQRHPEVETSRLLDHLEAASINVDVADKTIQTAKEILKAKGPIGIDQVAPFLRSVSYIVCLEGAKDIYGRPVIYIKGVPHGTQAEIEAQIIYAVERSNAHREGGEGFLVVTSIRCGPTSRLLMGKAFRSALDTLCAIYPYNPNTGVVLMDVPRAAKWCMKLSNVIVFNILPALKSLSFVSSKADLANLIPAESRLPEWGGTFHGGLGEEYILARAAAEGCPVTDEVREYNPKSSQVGTDAPDDPMNSMSLTEAMVANPVLVGTLWKRGRGGILGSSRWKRKAFVLLESHLLYYDAKMCPDHPRCKEDEEASQEEKPMATDRAGAGENGGPGGGVHVDAGEEGGGVDAMPRRAIALAGQGVTVQEFKDGNREAQRSDGAPGPTRGTTKGGGGQGWGWGLGWIWNDDSARCGTPEHTFAVQTPLRTFLLAAETLEEKESWVGKLRELTAGSTVDGGTRDKEGGANMVADLELVQHTIG